MKTLKYMPIESGIPGEEFTLDLPSDAKVVWLWVQPVMGRLEVAGQRQVGLAFKVLAVLDMEAPDVPRRFCLVQADMTLPDGAEYVATTYLMTQEGPLDFHLFELLQVKLVGLEV